MCDIILYFILTIWYPYVVPYPLRLDIFYKTAIVLSKLVLVVLYYNKFDLQTSS